MKKYIISGVIVLCSLGIIFGVFYLGKDKKQQKIKEEITTTVKEYYKNNTVDNTKAVTYFLDKNVYQQHYEEKYPFLHNAEDNNEIFKVYAKEYYKELDEKIEYQVDLESISILKNEVAAVFKISYLDCYLVSNVGELNTEGTNVMDENTFSTMFTTLKEQSSQCLKENKKKEKLVTITLKKEKNSWKIDQFDSVVDKEVSKGKTSLKKGVIALNSTFANVTTNTSFRFIDFDLKSEKSKLYLDQKQHNLNFKFSKNDTMKTSFEVKGTKSESFVVQIYDENMNQLKEKTFKLTKEKQVFTIKWNQKEKLNMLQIYLIDKKDLNIKEKPLDQKAFGRIFIYEK